MNSRLLVTIAMLGLVGSASLAQDSFGKKGDRASESSKGDQSRVSHGSSGSASGSTVRSQPAQRSGGGGYFGRASSSPQDRSSGYGRPQSSSQGRAYGRPSSSSAGGAFQDRGSTLGRPERTSGRGSFGGDRDLGRPQPNSGRVDPYQNFGRPQPSAGSGSTYPKTNQGYGLGRPDPYQNRGGGAQRGFTFDPQDGLGKKGGGKGGGQQGGGSGSGTVRTDPPPRRTGSGDGQGGAAQVTRPPLGRPERTTGQVGDDSGTFGKRGNGDSRSGRVNYGGASHNNMGEATGRGFVRPHGFTEAPTVGNNNRISREVNRENRVHVADRRFRQGYWGYSRGWSDDSFFYPFYGFTWYQGCNYVTSPFYSYYTLPGYIDCTRVHIGPITWVSCSTSYRWTPYNVGWGYDSYDNRAELDRAIDDIQASFERGSIRYIGRLIPSRGRIDINAGWNNQYSLSGDDFYDMMRDLVENTRTRQYRIVDVRRDGNRAQVYAEHIYEDPWGDEQVVRHIFGLREYRGRYEIAYFETDARRD